MFAEYDSRLPGIDPRVAERELRQEARKKSGKKTMRERARDAYRWFEQRFRADKKVTQYAVFQAREKTSFREENERMKREIATFVLRPQITLEQVNQIFFPNLLDIKSPAIVMRFASSDLEKPFSAQEILAILKIKIEMIGDVDDDERAAARQVVTEWAHILLNQNIAESVDLIGSPLFTDEQQQAFFDLILSRNASTFRDDGGLFYKDRFTSDTRAEHYRVTMQGVNIIRTALAVLAHLTTSTENQNQATIQKIVTVLQRELRMLLGAEDWSFHQLLREQGREPRELPYLNPSEMEVVRELTIGAARGMFINAVERNTSADQVFTMPPQIVKVLSKILIEVQRMGRMQSYIVNLIQTLVPIEQLATQEDNPIAQLIFLTKKRVPFLPELSDYDDSYGIQVELREMAAILSDESVAQGITPLLLFFSQGGVGNTKNFRDALGGRSDAERDQIRAQLKSEVYSQPLFAHLARVICRTGRYRHNYMAMMLCGWCDGKQFYDGLTEDEKYAVPYVDDDAIQISAGNSLQLCPDAENRMRTAINGGAAIDIGNTTPALPHTRPLEAVVPWFPNQAMQTQYLELRRRKAAGTDQPIPESSRRFVMGAVKYYGRPIGLSTRIVATPNGVFVPGGWWHQVGDTLSDQILAEGCVSLDSDQHKSQVWILMRTTNYQNNRLELTVTHKLDSAEASVMPPTVTELNRMYGAG